jgi:hypothetical protein
MTLLASYGIDPNSFVLGLIFGGIAGMLLTFGLVTLIDRLAAKEDL